MKLKSIFLAGILVSKGAFASLPPAEEVNGELVPQLTHEQLQKALATLLEEGIIEWVDGRFILKDQNALDQLRARGRVDLITAAYGSICF